MFYTYFFWSFWINDPGTWSENKILLKPALKAFVVVSIYFNILNQSENAIFTLFTFIPLEFFVINGQYQGRHILNISSRNTVIKFLNCHWYNQLNEVYSLSSIFKAPSKQKLILYILIVIILIMVCFYFLDKTKIIGVKFNYLPM